MKLFGSKKSPRSAAPEKGGAASDETKVLPRIQNRIKASYVRVKTDKKRAALISIYAAAALLFVVLLVSVGSRMWDVVREEADNSVLKEENLYDNEGKNEDSDTPDVVLPLIPSRRDDEDMMSVPHGETEVEQLKNSNYRNFLFAVYDNKGVSVDTVILGRIDLSANKLDLVNIPRDTLVNVSWDLKRISTVMQRENGDIQRFLNELGSILGFSIDYYALIEADTVADIVDAIGGLYYIVPRNMVSVSENVSLSSGLQWLNGARAQMMLKFCFGDNGSGYPDGELGRIKTVQDFIMELLAMYISGSEGPNIDEVIKVLAENSEGNIDEALLRSFADVLYEADGSNIRFATMPGANVRIRNTTYYEISAVEWAEMVNEYLNPYAEEIHLHNLDILMFDPEENSVMSTYGEIIDFNSFY